MLEVGTRAVPIFLPAAAASSAAFLPCMRTTSAAKVIALMTAMSSAELLQSQLLATLRPLGKRSASDVVAVAGWKA